MGAARQASGAMPLHQACHTCVAGTPHSSRQRAALEQQEEELEGQVEAQRGDKCQGAKEQTVDLQPVGRFGCSVTPMLLASWHKWPLTFQVRCRNVIIGVVGTLSKLPMNWASRCGV